VHPQVRQEFESAYAVWWKRVKYSEGGYATGAAVARREQLSRVENRVLIGCPPPRPSRSQTGRKARSPRAGRR